MIAFPDIDPVAIQLGPIAVHWYGISYIVGIGLGWWLLSRAAGRSDYANFSKDEVADLVFYCAIGAVLGGRMGYVVFYNFAEFIAQPAEQFAQGLRHDTDFVS